MLVHTPKYWVILSWAVMLGSCWGTNSCRGDHLPFLQCNCTCWLQQSGEPKDLKGPRVRREATVVLSQPLKTGKTVVEKSPGWDSEVDPVFHV